MLGQRGLKGHAFGFFLRAPNIGILHILLKFSYRTPILKLCRYEVAAACTPRAKEDKIMAPSVLFLAPQRIGTNWILQKVIDHDQARFTADETILISKMTRNTRLIFQLRK
jgi:hypothetical protein